MIRRKHLCGCTLLSVFSLMGFTAWAVTAAANDTPPDLPPLTPRAPVNDARVGVASVPLLPDQRGRIGSKTAETAWLAPSGSLENGDVLMDGTRVQAQVLSTGMNPRVLLRWLGGRLPEAFTGKTEVQPAAVHDAGWSFDYKLIEGNADKEVEWKPVVRGLPLELTAYEMYQLNLQHGGQHIGLRLGLRWNGRIYWWQFVRADFLQRGPVFDLMRVGGPIYNEDTTLQSDLFLVLYANGVIEAYAHFINNMREGIGRDCRGIPVIAFDVPGAGTVNHTLDGTRSTFTLGPCTLDLASSAGYGSREHPGSLRLEEGVAVLQPWEDQQINGGLLVDPQGVPEGNIIDNGTRGAPDYWVTKVGEKMIPRGVARTVPFRLSLGPVPPEVARYQAPPWWYGACQALPTAGFLPVRWWALPRALELAQKYNDPDRQLPPFELGRSGHDSDGTVGAALQLLGNASGDGSLCERGLLPAYWWADIAIDHVDFTVHEIPKYSWQYLVQPYSRWMEALFAYYETGDPYLLETSRLTADAYYRFFVTNHPHRFVGRDALGCGDLMELYRCTGDTIYRDRMRQILATARGTYRQRDWYMPGHQSGSGTNGVARQQDFDYIPMLLARLNVQLLETGPLPSEETEDIWDFIRYIADFCSRHDGGGWVMRGVSLSYNVLPTLADHDPRDAKRWLGMLMNWNAEYKLPDEHDGGKAYDWTISALRFDAWSWGATWRDGALYLRPRATVFDPRAPRTATIDTPKGTVKVAVKDGNVELAEPVDFAVHIEPE